jgi:hypothetical protein
MELYRIGCEEQSGWSWKWEYWAGLSVTYSIWRWQQYCSWDIAGE